MDGTHKYQKEIDDINDLILKEMELVSELINKLKNNGPPGEPLQDGPGRPLLDGSMECDNDLVDGSPLNESKQQEDVGSVVVDEEKDLLQKQSIFNIKIFISNEGWFITREDVFKIKDKCYATMIFPTSERKQFFSEVIKNCKVNSNDLLVSDSIKIILQKGDRYVKVRKDSNYLLEYQKKFTKYNVNYPLYLDLYGPWCLEEMEDFSNALKQKISEYINPDCVHTIIEYNTKEEVSFVNH